jgi:anti-sigma regulatory factor (Ser/Thr protein kinase)
VIINARGRQRPKVICLMQKKFTRSYDSLEKIFEFTELFFDKESIEESVRYPVHFVMEELFTNMVKYNPGNSSDILLNVDNKNGGITVSMTDYNVDVFDVTADRQVDIESPVHERRVGGLGLHLIQKMVDSLEYDYNDRQSTITFTKGFASTDV